ncbi:hypothetical protein FA15DRAFT_585222 [Coprinopsis marcescibilis]|uniref:AN1-type domain-containing protein n=1 Tax=Coprinopsis marcescibilis TaxID=230819 RepID=A0A5C3LHR1_COPMA|nr:hypothetical protein FA15DRAFT_585222 [Coprinopsis marcescibilis]
MSAQQERETHILDVGKKCSHSICNQVDFLPFTCQHCSESFCQEHYRVEGHQCPKYDEFKHNRVAPDCPLCKVPVAVAPGQDPNVRMELHFEKECVVVTGRVKAKTTPICARATCKKVLFSPIRCDNCREQFCPSHRFPSDHSCKVPESRRAPAPARPKHTMAGASSTAKELNAKAAAKASEAVDSVQKGLAAAKASTAATTSKLPFNKTDRRAKAERESRIKAMEMRDKKGLLSAEEKKTLAQYKEEMNQKGDCIVM